MEKKLRYPDAEVDLDVYVKKAYNIQAAKLQKEEKVLNLLTNAKIYFVIAVVSLTIGIILLHYKKEFDTEILRKILFVCTHLGIILSIFSGEIKQFLSSLILRSKPKVDSLKEWKEKLLTQLVLQEKKYQYADEYFEECGYSNETIPFDDFNNLIQGMSEEGILKMISNKEANKIDSVRNLKRYLLSDSRFNCFVDAFTFRETLTQPIKGILNSDVSLQIGWPTSNRWHNLNLIKKEKPKI